MIIGKVKGSLVSTRKLDTLQGYKLLVIEPIYDEKKEFFVAVDGVGAGVGEYVLVTKGSSASKGLTRGEAAIDALVVGILDEEPSF